MIMDYFQRILDVVTQHSKRPTDPALMSAILQLSKEVTTMSAKLDELVSDVQGLTAAYAPVLQALHDSQAANTDLETKLQAALAANSGADTDAAIQTAIDAVQAAKAAAAAAIANAPTTPAVPPVDPNTGAPAASGAAASTGTDASSTAASTDSSGAAASTQSAAASSSTDQAQQDQGQQSNPGTAAS